MLRILPILSLWILTLACGGDKGIKEPLLPDEPPATDESATPLSALYGNYFLLANECPNDGSALRVAQSEEAIQLQGGFSFLSDQGPLIGFVDEEEELRFFASRNGTDVNCTALSENEEIFGVCTFQESGLFETCRFAYGKEVSGSYAPVWNDCQNDGSSLLLTRSQKTKIELEGGFAYQGGGGTDRYFGVIQSGKILFNIAALQAVDLVVTDDDIAFNCEAVVGGDILTGACTDLTKSPATQCTFGYQSVTRLATVDLNDDERFPEPAITPSVGTDLVTDMSGVYAVLSNNCDDDGGSLEVFQEGTSLGFVGGFDYQAADPDLYAGTIDAAGTVRFSVLGGTARAFCTANLTLNAQGVSGLAGACDVEGDGAESCSFTYSKVQ